MVSPESFKISNDENIDDGKPGIVDGAVLKDEMGMSINCLHKQDTRIDGKFHSSVKTSNKIKRTLSHPVIKKISPIILTVIILLVSKRILRPGVLSQFLLWMELHPIQGIIAYTCIYPLHTILFLPGTPMVMGAGYIFKVQYGWIGGICLCTFVSLLGSFIGSLIAFLLGRYCMRSTVRKWSRKYPIFDAIDAAVSENGFKIMCLIYLTPVIPYGPVSYMVGTTSMPTIEFAKAKIAALPLTALYVYLGAATGTLVTASDTSADSNSGADGRIQNTNFDEVTLSPKVIIAGIVGSIASISIISIKMKKELDKILDRQKVEEQSSADNIVHSRIKEKNDGQTRQRHIPRSPPKLQNSV